jgi:hypothetical protein
MLNKNSSPKLDSNTIFLGRKEGIAAIAKRELPAKYPLYHNSPVLFYQIISKECKID